MISATTRLALNRPVGVLAIAAVLALAGVPAHAYQATQQFNQAEQRAANGQLIREKSLITVVACNGAGETGGQRYIYKYLNRPGFRAINPSNWGQALGGRDWDSFQQAVGAACVAHVSSPAPRPTPPAPTGGLWTWQQVGVGDCTGNDIAETDGFQPKDNQAKAGYTAICWDGKSYNNTYTRKGQAFCTYKNMSVSRCTGGTNFGVSYQAVQR